MRRIILFAPWILLVLSCTRMPTAPRALVQVTGKVTDPSGEPFANVSLRFWPEEHALLDYANTYSDSAGAYSVYLPSGKYQVDLEPVRAPEFMTRREHVTVGEGQDHLDFAFRGFRVTGTLLDPSGGVIDTGEVFVELRGQGTAFSRFEQGRYSLFLPTGIYSFTATDADYWSGYSPGDWKSLPIAADTTLDLRLGGIPISGVVRGPDGAPMSAVRVEAAVPNGYRLCGNESGSDGSYRLYVPQGSYLLLFQPPYPFNIVPRVMPVTVSAPLSIDGDLSGVAWSGTVLRSGTNEPASNVTAGVQMLDDAYHRNAAIRTGSQGEFRLIVEANRRYDLRVYDPVTRSEAARIQGVTATTDTTFEISIPPAPAP